MSTSIQSRRARPKKSTQSQRARGPTCSYHRRRLHNSIKAGEIFFGCSSVLYYSSSVDYHNLSLANFFSLTHSKTMLFAKVAALALFPLLAVATPWGTPTTTPPVTVTVTATATATQTALSQCNVSNQQCCNSLQSSSDSLVSLLLGLLGVVLDGVTAEVGLTCSPLNIIGVTGTSCSAQPVCCENNSFSNAVSSIDRRCFF